MVGNDPALGFHTPGSEDDQLQKALAESMKETTNTPDDHDENTQK